MYLSVRPTTTWVYTLKMERSVVKGSTQYLCTSAFNWKVILATTLLLNFLICCLFFLSNLLFYFQATYQVVRKQEAIVLRMFEWLAPLRNTNKSGLLRFTWNDTVEIFTRLRIAIWVGKNCMITVQDKGGSSGMWNSIGDVWILRHIYWDMSQV